MTSTPSRDRYYDDSHGVQAVAEEVAGVKLDDFFRRYVAGTDEIPYENFFNAAGLELKAETQKGADLGFLDRPAMACRQLLSQVVPGSVSGSSRAEGRRYACSRINGQPLPRSLPAWLREHAPGEKLRSPFIASNKI